MSLPPVYGGLKTSQVDAGMSFAVAQKPPFFQSVRLFLVDVVQFLPQHQHQLDLVTSFSNRLSNTACYHVSVGKGGEN